MNTIQKEIQDNYLILRLNRGKVNAMNMEMVLEIRATIKEAKENPAIKGLLITGKPHYFTAGLDIIQLYEYNETEIAAFWKEFAGMKNDLVCFPKPLVAALTGHSPAGGCVIAICCDYRVMAEGKYKIGLNEIPVGIVVPEHIFNLYAFWLGQGKAYQFILEGKLLSTQEALDCQLIDELAPLELVEAKGIEKLKQYLSYDQKTWKISKRNLRNQLIKDTEINVELALKDTIEQWWAPGSRARLKSMINRLKSPTT